MAGFDLNYIEDMTFHDHFGCGESSWHSGDQYGMSGNDCAAVVCTRFHNHFVVI